VTDHFRLLHLSDPHFGSERPVVVRALQALAQALEPSLTVVSGDLTQRARPHQFRAAGRFFGALKAVTADAPQLIVPGNHDVPILNLLARVRAPYALFCETFGPDREPVFDDVSVLVLGVDTSTPRRRVDGEVTEQQQQRVSAALANARPEQLKVVVVHQPVAVPADSQRQRLLHGGQAAAQAWVRAGADLILGGHIHLPFVLPVSEAGDSMAGPAWLVHAGTAVSDRLRMGAPNSVNEFRYARESRSLRLRRWDFDEASESFRVRNDQPLPLTHSSLAD
jgi:3',5'-cyclic AMP phosphodiesterase CpdA